jgi:nicotinate-nucleotide adenylyltransferase
LRAGQETWHGSKASVANTRFTDLEKIGIYGGSFDPVHHGHLILARFALEKFVLEKIIFVPTRLSPHKNASVATGEARLQMLRSATEGEPQFAVDDCELQRDPPSYTIDTVEKIRQKYPNAHLFLLIGDDNLAGLSSWRGFDELRKIVTLIILQRAVSPVTHEYLSVDRRFDISATEIRARIASARSIRYLVPGAVEQIIRGHGLYLEATK